MGRLAWSCALACIPLLPAQQRTPTFFTVVDAEGKPLPGATVTCTFEPTILSPGTRDVVTATTDERGRARAGLAPGCLYTAWATGAAAADGSVLASECVELVIAGQVRELAAHDRRPPRTIAVDGIEAWRNVGGKALRWLPVAGVDVAVELALPTDKKVALAPSPAVRGQLAIVDARGVALVTTTMQPDATAATFEAPVEVTCRVLDEQGNPIAGATIDRPRGMRRPEALFPAAEPASQTPGDVTGLGAVTGADGTCTVHLVMPIRSAPISLPPQLLHAGAPGRQWRGAPVKGPGPVEFRLPPAVRSAIVVRGAANATSELTATTFLSVRIDRGTRSSTHDLRTTRDADDRWTLEHGDSPVSLRLCAPDCVPIVAHTKNPTTTPVGFDTGEWATIDTVVVDAEGAPRASALAVGQCRPGRITWVWSTATDLAGRSRFRVPNGDFALYATTGTQHGMVLVDRTRTTPHEVRLAGIPTMRLRVRDAAGKPVAGARAEPVQSSNVQPTGEPLAQAWQAAAIDLHRRYVGTTRSDRDGVLLVPAFVIGAVASKVVVRAGASACQPIALVPDTEAAVELGR